jgi:hypothetical protein
VAGVQERGVSADSPSGSQSSPDGGKLRRGGALEDASSRHHSALCRWGGDWKPETDFDEFPFSVAFRPPSAAALRRRKTDANRERFCAGRGVFWRSIIAERRRAPSGRRKGKWQRPVDRAEPLCHVVLTGNSFNDNLSLRGPL